MGITVMVMVFNFVTLCIPCTLTHKKRYFTVFTMGVVVAHNGAGDVRWVEGGRMERAGARSVWVGERAGQHVP